MPRRLRFPDLPPGPQQELLVFLHELHRLAGEPSTREIAEGIVKASNGEVRCSHTTIHALLAGHKLPTKGDLLFELVKFLHSRNRRQRKTEDEILDELDDLWGPATRRHLLALPTPPPPASPAIPPTGYSAGPLPATEGTPSTARRLDDVFKDIFKDHPTNTPGAAHHHGAHHHREPVKPAEGHGVAFAAQDGNVLVHSSPPPADHTLVLDRQPESRPPALPVLQTSRAVLAGVSRYSDPGLPDIPAIPAGISRLSYLLQRHPGAFLGEHVTTLNNPGALELFESVERASADATDTLLVYFAGHGLVSPRRGDLLLATPDTAPSRDYTAAPYDTIRDLISSSRARRSVVILDCCFSGRALESMGSLDSLAEIPAAYVITSTSRNRAAFAPASSQYTAFTGALIETLQQGIQDGGELLTIRDIFGCLRRTAIEQGFPAPELRVHNDGGLALAYNPAYTPPQAKS